MTDSLRARIPFRALPFLLALACFACLFDKPKEAVDLTLTNVPAGTEQVQVVAVDGNDTSKVLDTLLAKTPWSPGRTLHFSLGPAQGKPWMLRVEGYRSGYLIYLALIPQSQTASGGVGHPDVTSGWPAVLFTAVKRDSANVTFSTAFRGVPAQVHWHLNPGADSAGGNDFIETSGPDLIVPAGRFAPGSLITADLHSDDQSLLPVQLPDTMLADEALSPSGASLQIIDAFTVNDSVYLKLDCKNFRTPAKDNPIPGQGNPKALDARGLRPLAGFGMVGNDSSLLAGPSAALEGVDKIVVALYYANDMRVRPPAADTMDAAAALRPHVEVPTLKILSFAPVGADLQIVLQRRNFDGLHCHISRNLLNALDYQICRADTCLVDSSIWKGAKIVIVAAHLDRDHSLVRPLVADTLTPPP